MMAIAKKFIKYATSAANAVAWGWKNKENSLAIYTASSSKGLRVHLGSGPINLQGWVNVDARYYPHIHLISEGFELREFVDGVIAEVYLCHVLEHFSFEEAATLLRMLRRKLAPGGLLRLSVPSFDRLINVYREADNNIDLIKFAIMGGQDYQYNFHKSIYNLKSLSLLLEETGFENVTEWKTLEDFGVDIGDWSSGTISVAGARWQISLNVKAIKWG